MSYNPKYLRDKNLIQLKPKKDAIHTFKTPEGILIGMFQGSRGQFPDLDFVIRILKPGENERPFAPLHSFWVVDLMMKTIEYREEVISLLEFYIDFYKRVKPFESVEERQSFQFETVDKICQQFRHIQQSHTLSLEYVSMIIELFCINEKRNEGAYMFYNLLNNLLSYAKEETDYMSVIQAAQPGFRR